MLSIDRAAFPHRESWIWAVLPPDVARVAAVGDPRLADALRDAGIEVTGPGEDAEAMLADARGVGGLRALRDVTRGARAPLVAVAIGAGGGTGPERMPLVARRLELIVRTPPRAAFAWLGARLVARRLRAEGRAVSVVWIGDRDRDTYGISRRRVTPRFAGVDAAVAGRLGKARPSALESVIHEAARTLGLRPRVETITVGENGKLVVALADTGSGRHFVRLAAGAAAESLRRSRDVLSLIGGGAPSAVRDRLPRLAASGDVGTVHFTAEEGAAGSAPGALTDPLWSACIEFLAGLHSTPSGGAAPAGEGGFDRIRGALDSLGAHADAGERGALERLTGRLAESLDGLPLGWRHGDFWPENLLVEDDRLATVLDWDDAAPGSLPLLDLLDLIAAEDPRGRGLRAGQRFETVLLPIVSSGDDPRIAAYCEATGIPCDRGVVEGLAAACWVDRVAADLRRRPDLARRPRWLADNVRRPLAAAVRMR